MRILLLAIIISVIPAFGIAAEISDKDVATYALTRKDGQFTDMQIRLSINSGKWVMEGKNSQTPWKNISCDRDCEYRPSTQEEKNAYLASFPSEMQKQFDIACIQNVANAFCSLTKKDNPSKGGYTFIALVTGRPVPMSLQRLTR